MLSEAIEIIGWTLLHFVWQGIAAVMLLSVLLLMLRRATAHARYLAACGAFGLMAFAPLVTSWWLSAQSRDLGTEIPADSRRVGRVIETHQDLPTDMVGLDDSIHPTDEPTDVGRTAPVIVAGAANVSSQTQAASDTSIAAGPSWLEHIRQLVERYLAGIVGVWLFGVLLLSLRLLVGWLSVQRLLRRTHQPANETWQSLLRRLAERLRVTRPVRLVESALVEVPAVIGWLRPIILLPASAMTGLTTEQLEALLAHELAHVRRHDYLVNLLQTVVETLLFYHPAVWWLSHRIRIEREHCCDDLAASLCGDRLSYAKALFAMEELRTPPLGLAMSARGGSLLSRVTRLLGVADEPSRSIGWLAGLIAMLTLTVAAALGAGLLTPPERGPDQRRGQETRAEREPIKQSRFVGRVRLKLDGEKPLPDLEKVEVPAGKVLDESLVFSKDGGLANVFVYLRKPTFPIEPATEAELAKPFVLIADGAKFFPHAALIRVGRPLVLENIDDREANSVRLELLRNGNWNVVVPRQERAKPFALKFAEQYPTPVNSDLHPWMRSHLLVLDHPFAAVTDDDGRFAINGLPPGEHEFRIWHERVGYLEKSLKITIQPGEDAKSELEYAPDRLKLTEADVLAWGKDLIDVKWVPRAMVPRPAVQPPNEGAKENLNEKELKPAEPRKPTQAQTEVDRARRNVLRQKAASDVNIRFAKASAAVAKAEWEKAQEGNRKVPGTIPESELLRAKSNLEKTELQIRVAEAERDAALAQLVDENLDKPSAKTLEARLRAAKPIVEFERASANVAKQEWDKQQEANRKVPGSIPAATVERARLAYGAAVLRGEQADAEVAKLQALQAGKPAEDRTARLLELRWQLAKAEAELAQAEYETILGSNRKVPGTVPVTEVERARLQWEKAKLVVEQVQHEQTVAKLSAIRNAVAFLKAQQQQNGTWQGTPEDGVTALCAAALLQAGVKADDPVMQKALAHLRKVEPTLSYMVAFQTMVFCWASPKEDVELIQRNVAWLEKAQVADGKSRGAWSYAVTNGGRGDGSCSRFAVLGLDAAKRAGFEVKDETWRRVSDYWLTTQKDKAAWGYGWGYTPDSGPTPTMTLAGIAALATANRHLPNDDQTKTREAAIRKPADYLEKMIPEWPRATFALYSLHSLERAGHLSGLKEFGKLDWKPEATKRLLELQQPNGSWKGNAQSESELIATSFAILFLTGQPEQKLVGRRLLIEPREKDKSIQIHSERIEKSTPPVQRTVISGGVRIEAIEPDGSKWRIEADRTVIESHAVVEEQFELNLASDVTRIVCNGSVKLWAKRGDDVSEVTAENLELDLRKLDGVLNSPRILP